MFSPLVLTSIRSCRYNCMLITFQKDEVSLLVRCCQSLFPVEAEIWVDVLILMGKGFVFDREEISDPDE